MGFYGNITNTNKTQFTFDRIYPNRGIMDQNVNTDNVYLGRYVLVEYDTNITDSQQQGNDYFKAYPDDYENPTRFYTSADEATRTIIKVGTERKSDTVLIDDIIYIQKGSDTTGSRKFYKCTGEKDDDTHEADFKFIADDSEGSNYTINYNLDNEKYKTDGHDIGRGYDSTVWQKVYTDNQQKYVMIAELNSVVPTFAVSVDAPTMTPLAPHFDTSSTSVYYQLHVQPQWGFRVAAAGDSEKSDEKVIHYSSTYNPTSDKIETEEEEVNGAIYYNKEAFNKQLNKEEEIHKTDDETSNSISVQPTGSTGRQIYNSHKGNGGLETANDIQEVRINLPAIGNMMSDAWDIIHGPLRNNDMRQFDENGERVDSLQGRLDSIAAIGENEIPVKRISDGRLVGTLINGAKEFVEEKDILNEELSKSFNQDDAWIYTKIDSSIITEENKSGIAIHHTFHETKDSVSEVNKNKDVDDIYNSYYLSKKADISKNDEEGVTDFIKLYTPYVDAAGHVVGHDTEYVTLPYGFKTISTNGRSDNTDVNADSDLVTDPVVADNTQDVFTINSGNKWIRIDTDVENDAIKISHDVHNTSSSTSTQDLTDENAATTFDVPTYLFDKAGHYTSHDMKTITVPYGYGKIIGDVGETAASATVDTIIFASDAWLTATVEKDKVTYSHDYPEVKDDTTSTTDINGNGDIITLETLEKDAKGHVIKVNKNTVTLPYGYKTFKVQGNGESSASNTQDIMEIAGDSWISPKVEPDKIIINHIGPVSGNNSSKNNEAPAFGSPFTIEDWYFDDKGHKNEGKSHTITIPKGSLVDDSANGSDLITQLAFVDTEGKLSTTRTNISSLKLQGYNKGTDSNDISSEDTLGAALGKLQVQIENEKTDRANAITTLLGGENINEAFDTIREIAEWLEANDSGADKVIDDIATLNADAETEGSVAYIVKQETDAREASIKAINENIDALELVDNGFASRLNTLEAKPSFGIDNEDIEAWNKAEENIQSDWNEEDTNSDAYILNKPDLSDMVETSTKFTYQEADDENEAITMTIQDMLDYIKTLEERIAALESPIEE